MKMKSKNIWLKAGAVTMAFAVGTGVLLPSVLNSGNMSAVYAQEANVYSQVPSDVNVIDATTVWKYLDDNTDPAKGLGSLTAWTTSDFNDGAWKSAAGSFGAKRGQLTEFDGFTPTVLLNQYKSDVPNEDVPTFFFRSTFEVENLSEITSITGTLYHDDASMTFGWPWKDIAEFVVRQREHAISSIRLAAAVCEECDKLYEGKPGDDTTVAVMQIIDRRPVHLMTGPPVDRDDDERIISEFMKDETASRIVSGGTSATILSRELGRPLKVSMDYTDPEIPPIAYMDGIELVTEGVLTLSRVVDILNRFVEKKDLSYDFFKELDKNNGASMLAKILIEDCTELNLYVGKAINSAYQNPGLPFDLGIRQNLVRQLKTAVEKMGKRVTVTYY